VGTFASKTQQNRGLTSSAAETAIEKQCRRRKAWCDTLRRGLTLQTPQDLDTQHGGELFPVEENSAATTRLLATKTRGGQDRGRNFRQ
jgi:hypothetical protein